MTQNSTFSLPDAALFLDAENWCGGCGDMGVPFEISPELERLKSFVRPVIRRSFGDLQALPYSFDRNSVTTHHPAMPH